MPGKVNPTQSEALTMVAVQVFGNDAAVAFGGSQGNFQLNVFKPVMLHNLLESASLLADGCLAFDIGCAQGIEPDLKRIAPTWPAPDAGHRAEPAYRLRKIGADRAEGASRGNQPERRGAGRWGILLPKISMPGLNRKR